MKVSSFRQRFALLLAAILLSGSSMWASDAKVAKSSDYALGQDGTLAGSILNQSAKPVVGLHVHVLHLDQVVATAISDEQGRFSVSGLRNGVHTLQIGASREKVRFWSQDAAPPGSISRMAVIVDEQVVRGQDSNTVNWNTVGTVAVFGGALAATLATTLATTIDEDGTLDTHTDAGRPASP